MNAIIGCPHTRQTDPVTLSVGRSGRTVFIAVRAATYTRYLRLDLDQARALADGLRQEVDAGDAPRLPR